MSKLEVSFNSPQCGWMSIGMEGSSGEFRTTTAFQPHTNALAELMDALADMARASEGEWKRMIRWNRDPEEYDFVLSRNGTEARIEVFEYPTGERNEDERELAFRHTGDAIQCVRAFAETFQQLYDERGVDDFSDNWHQEFPFRSFENLKNSL